MGTTRKISRLSGLRTDADGFSSLPVRARARAHTRMGSNAEYPSASVRTAPLAGLVQRRGQP